MAGPEPEAKVMLKIPHVPPKVKGRVRKLEEARRGYWS